MRETMVSLERTDHGNYAYKDLLIENINGRWYVFDEWFVDSLMPLADFATLREVRAWLYEREEN